MEIRTAIQRMLARTELEQQLYPVPKVAFRIRPYCEEDRESLLAIYDHNAPGRFPDGDRVYFQEYLDSERQSFFVVSTAGGRVVGCGGVTSFSENVHVLCFGMISPSFQGMGIGRTLAAARLEAAARKPGNHRAIIFAVEQSITFYSRLGFRKIAQTWRGGDGKEYPIGLLDYSESMLGRVWRRLRDRGHLIDPACPIDHAVEWTPDCRDVLSEQSKMPVDPQGDCTSTGDDDMDRRRTVLALRRSRSVFDTLFGLLKTKPYSSAFQDAFRLSKIEARKLGHRTCTSSHLLLGILQSPAGLGPEILRRLGCQYDDIHREIIEKLGGAEALSADASLKISGDFKIALALASRSSKQRGDKFVGSHHAVLGFLLRDNLASDLLKARGIQKETVESELETMAKERPLID